MKYLSIILVSTLIYSCNTQPVPVYQSSPVVIQQPVQQVQSDPYQVYDNGSGGQVVYYTDPTTHASYWLEYAIFMSMWNSPNRYYSINHYYVSHRSYIDSRSTYYRNNYTRRSSSTLNSNRSSSPGMNRPSSPGQSSSANRPSSPVTRPNYSTRTSSPSSSSVRPSSSTRSSSPSNRRN